VRKPFEASPRFVLLQRLSEADMTEAAIFEAASVGGLFRFTVTAVETGSGKDMPA
jgi:hypothetical protein